MIMATLKHPAPTRVLVQLGLGRLPPGPGGLGSLLPPHQLILKALVQVPQFAGAHHGRVALEQSDLQGDLCDTPTLLRAACTQLKRGGYHLVHGVVGVVALCVCAADPCRLQQQLLLVLLLLALLFLPLNRKHLLRFSAPGGAVSAAAAASTTTTTTSTAAAALSAQTRGALRAPLPLLLPAAALPVSAGGAAAKRRRSNPTQTSHHDCHRRTRNDLNEPYYRPIGGKQRQLATTLTDYFFNCVIIFFVSIIINLTDEGKTLLGLQNDSESQFLKTSLRSSKKMLVLPSLPLPVSVR